MITAAHAQPVVLVVEDEAILLMNAVEVLHDAGFQTVEAGNALDALARLGEHPEISVLFTDINMPGPLDGLALAQQVHARRPDIQLILTSGRVAPSRAEIPDDGRFIAKPYDARTVTDMIRAVSA